MMQSSPLNARRAVLWGGRLILGGIFIYAGYSKLFFPNTNFWPYFFLKLSLSANISNFALQVEAFKLLPPWGVQFVAHTLPFSEIVLGLLLLIGWRLRIWASLLTLIMLGFFVVVTRAYVLHMDINCGCFATPEPIGPRKILEDAALSVLAVLMTYFAFVEARQPHPWSAPEKA
jgi:uncharacterized membrane protein YphA (DoxX/SURF4 family)